MLLRSLQITAWATVTYNMLQLPVYMLHIRVRISSTFSIRRRKPYFDRSDLRDW